MMEPIDSIQNAIALADGWQKKGEPIRSLLCVEGALTGYLQHAVREPSTPEALAWLRAHNVDQLLGRCFVNLQEVCLLVDRGRLPSSVIAGNYGHLVHSHLACLFDDYERGIGFLDVARRTDVLEVSTPFWCEYSRGMRALIDGAEYMPATLKLRGIENWWASYLRLISAATKGQPVDAALREVDQSFRHRNEKGKIEDDGSGIEGCSQDPVSWDFRRDAILTYVKC